MWVWSLGREDLLEEGVATCSSILAWRIPWTEKPVCPHQATACPSPSTSEVTKSRAWLSEFTFIATEKFHFLRTIPKGISQIMAQHQWKFASRNISLSLYFISIYEFQYSASFADIFPTKLAWNSLTHRNKSYLSNWELIFTFASLSIYMNTKTFI